jgi:hypothetical protein
LGVGLKFLKMNLRIILKTVHALINNKEFILSRSFKN